MMPMQTVHGGMGNGGHLYIQTNESHNAVIHYRRSANGAIEEVERVSTGGAGSGGYNPIVNRESTPNPFGGARSVISVSSFTVDDEGRLTLVDVKQTGNIVPGPSGSAKSLAYDADSRTGPVVEIDTTRSKPSELCWLSICPDDRIVYAANFGYSYVTSFFLVAIPYNSSQGLAGF